MPNLFAIFTSGFVACTLATTAFAQKIGNDLQVEHPAPYAPAKLDEVTFRSLQQDAGQASLRTQDLLRTNRSSYEPYNEFTEGYSIDMTDAVGRTFTRKFDGPYTQLVTRWLQSIESEFALIQRMQRQVASHTDLRDVRIGFAGDAKSLSHSQLRTYLASWTEAAELVNHEVNRRLDSYYGGEDEVLSQYQSQQSIYLQATTALRTIIEHMEILHENLYDVHFLLDELASIPSDADRLNFLKRNRLCTQMLVESRT